MVLIAVIERLQFFLKSCNIHLICCTNGLFEDIAPSHWSDRVKGGSIIYRLTKAALNNVTFIILLVVIGIAGGIWSLFQMPIESFPSISAPVVNIVTQYPSAPPKTVAEDVTAPIEEALIGLPNISSVNSTSSEGYSVVTAEFNVGVNTSQTDSAVTRALQGIALPQGASTPTINTLDLNALPIMIVSLSGPSLSQLGQIANHVIAPALSSVSGVSSVTVAGVDSPAIQITLNPQALQAHHLSPEEISTDVQDALKTFPLGQAVMNNKGISIVAAPAANTLEQLANLPIVSSTLSLPNTSKMSHFSPSANSLTLKNLATLNTVTAPASTISRLDGHPSVTLNVIETSDANTVDVAHNVLQQINTLQSQLPKGVTLSVLQNQATSIKASVNGMAREAILGAILAVIVIAFFLWNGRSTLVAVVAIPLSIFISMIVLHAMGITLNMMTLGGMAVAVGRVVDDSIVMLESVYRRMQATGQRGADAIIHGAKEVASAITASTLTTIGVFFPIGLVSGIVGEFFRPFALTVVFSLIASWFVALVVNPILIHVFLGKGHIDTKHEWAPARLYRKVLRWSLHHPFVVLSSAAILLVGSLALVPTIGTAFLPPTSTPSLNAKMILPAGTTLAATNADSLQVEKVIRHLPGVLQYQTTVGAPTKASKSIVQSNVANFFISLAPTADPQNLSTELDNRLNALHLSGATFSVAPGSSFGGGSSTNQLQVLVQSSNPAHLAAASQTVARIMQQQPGVSQVQNQLATNQPEITVQIKPSAAAALDLTSSDILGQLSPYFVNSQVGTLSSQTSAIPVYLQLPHNSTMSLSALKNVPIQTPLGHSVPLSQVATVSMQSVQTTITQTNGIPTATVSAVITAQNVGKVTHLIAHAIAKAHLPSGVSTVMGGVSQLQSQAFSQLGEAIVAAIILVYLIMVLAFGGGLAPLAILFSLPLAVIGALLGLYISHQPLGIPALIGFLMLIGIVVTNAIVLVDLVQQHRHEGMALDDALLQAGSTRLRPILMTALATIGALLPLALGANEGSLISASLAVVVIGGLFTSTLLTLVVVPIMYRILHHGRRHSGNSQIKTA
ncbi:MAG: hypothetical protein C7B47_01840 [Sulfobacillus thermosulfidooxidans]|uniref:AcrB/AcrD/AcrF family protein n=1 Tax=Sulfobacillus thermosulfidooxidans TaxID=28034 RepID=A0A2T2X4P8_SULTH|nr:MAG: hypothetical protein C7B47_01840 [Sulfobacillus thermosulfidooxidans]